MLFSANAFARTYPKGHEREGDFRGFRIPSPGRYAGLDAALDSAGFVAAARYGDYRWTVEDYFDLVQSHPWTWFASMDLCCEPQVAKDRPLRLLRMAATAAMLGRCRREAKARGLPPPMPVLQGWTPEEYALSATWLPLPAWPGLVGVGSVCRRPVRGSAGVLAIVDALDAVLPAGIRLHLFGVKSAALAMLAHHPRVASVDSMAWDFQARAERRTGRDMEFRIGHMQAWAERQQHIAACCHASGVKAMLFDPAEFGGFTGIDELVLEALALQYADLLMSGDLDYRDAVHHCHVDGVIALARLRLYGLTAETLQAFDEMLAGFGARLAELHAALPPSQRVAAWHDGILSGGRGVPGPWGHDAASAGARAADIGTRRVSQLTRAGGACRPAPALRWRSSQGCSKAGQEEGGVLSA